MAIGDPKGTKDFLHKTQGWLVAGVNNAVTVNNVNGTTDDFEFRTDGTSGTIQFTIRLIFDNAAHDNLVSAERTT